MGATDSLIADATPLCQMCQTSPARPCSIGCQRGGLESRANNLYWDIVSAC